MLVEAFEVEYALYLQVSHLHVQVSHLNVPQCEREQPTLGVSAALV